MLISSCYMYILLSRADVVEMNEIKPPLRKEAFITLYILPFTLKCTQCSSRISLLPISIYCIYSLSTDDMNLQFICPKYH